MPFDKPTAEQPKTQTEMGSTVHQMFQPLERPEFLKGHTYKLRWPESEHALYVTINDFIHDGRERPYEVFINSKNMEHYAWTAALCRMISAVFRRGGDVTFVVEELKNVFDPRGGHWMGGRYVPSLLAALGEVIERHMVVIGFLKRDDDAFHDAEPQAKVVNMDVHGGHDGQDDDRHDDNGHDHRAGMRFCPKCNQPALIKSEGCDTCLDCGYSKCG